MSDTEWQKVLDAQPGHIFRDFYEDGVRVLVMRGPNSLCAYVGVPADHPLAGFDYDDVPLRCHCGLTFSSYGGGEGNYPEGWYWYGWDYSHAGDYATYYENYNFGPRDDRKWVVSEVETEAKMAAWDFARLKSLAERIANQPQDRI